MGSEDGNRVLVIVNPVSGGRAMGRALAEVVERLGAEGCEVVVLRTGRSGEATVMAAGAEQDTRAVVVVGGDGTVREVVEGLIGGRVPLVVMPGGTENLVAREFGMTSCARQIVRTVLRGQPRRCDVGVVNGRYFMIMAGIGYDADMVARLAARRTGRITHLSYVRPSLETFRSYGFPAIRVEIEGVEVFNDRGLVFVGNLPCYGMGLRILRDAVPDDGLLDVCILPCTSRWGFLGHAVRVFRGVHVEAPGVFYRRGRRLRVTSASRVLVQCDGDAAGELPAELSLRPAAVTLLAPRAED